MTYKQAETLRSEISELNERQSDGREGRKGLETTDSMYSCEMACKLLGSTGTVFESNAFSVLLCYIFSFFFVSFNKYPGKYTIVVLSGKHACYFLPYIMSLGILRMYFPSDCIKRDE